MMQGNSRSDRNGFQSAICLTAAVAATLLCIGSSYAQQADLAQPADRVWIEPLPPSEPRWYPQGIQILKGQVVRFDGEQLQLSMADREEDLVVRSDRVIWVEPSERSDEEQAAIDAYREGDYGSTLTGLPEILNQRPPIWRQQWITMLAADAAWKSGRAEIALELVKQLDRRSLPPLVLAKLPIAWRRYEANSKVSALARSHLDDSSAAAKLVAASWLLNSPDRTQAVETLKLLRREPRRPIAMSAAALLWRVATPPQVQQRAETWQQQLEQIPMTLQPGPAQTLIEKLAAAGLSEQANRLKWSTELTPIR